MDISAAKTAEAARHHVGLGRHALNAVCRGHRFSAPPAWRGGEKRGLTRTTTVAERHLYVSAIRADVRLSSPEAGCPDSDELLIW